MDEEKPRKRRTTTFVRLARTTRILARLREGLGYDENRPEGELTERRVPQILNAGSTWLSSPRKRGSRAAAADGRHFLAVLSPAAPGCPHPRA